MPFHELGVDTYGFAGPVGGGEADFVERHVGDLAANADLSRFIL